MSGGGRTFDRKQAYFTKLIALLKEHSTIFIVGADHVGSHHMQKIRMALRGKAEVLMGKNTMIRKTLRGYVQDHHPALEAILPYVRQNIGFVFAKPGVDLTAIRKIISETTVKAPARVGTVAPCNVILHAGPTGLDPSHTSFWAAMCISTKISRGQIEIVKDVDLIRAGEKVGASESALLAKLNIKPFSYALKILQIFDENGCMVQDQLDFEESLLEKFGLGVRNVAAASLGLSIPNLAAVPHLLVNAYQDVASVALEISGYNTELVKPSTLGTSSPADDEEEEDEFICYSGFFD